MKNLMLGLGLMVLIGSSVQAGDLRVNILNGTKGGPGFAERVAVVDLAQGMMEMSAAENVQGSTTISGISSEMQKQYLVRATYNGTNYSTTFSPNPALSAWETSVTVFDTEAELRDVTVTVPYFVMYAFEDHIYVQKRTILENQAQPPVTFYKPPGIVSVHVPENVIELDYLTFKHGTMPLKTQALPLDGKQVVPNALKPGTTEIDVAYTIPYDPSGTNVTEELAYDIGHFHVYSMPIGLSVFAPGLTREGTDNENGLAIWAMENVKAGTSLSFSVSGPGMKEGEEQQQQQSQNTGRIVVEQRLPMSNNLVIAGSLVLLLTIALFFSITQQQGDLKLESMRMLQEQKKTLLKKYANMAEANEGNPEVEQLLRQLISVYKTIERIA